ncbi:hypothetical protein EVA_17282 [gut metagenome]|uniref:Uncharacterized protein n=1 Tax=gut metagenome TaxID=749906 RepID=J9C4A2_9ZZZZ
MNSLGLHSGSLTHPLGGTACRSSQQNAQPHVLQGSNDTLGGSRLTGTRPTRQHHHFRADGFLDGL